MSAALISQSKDCFVTKIGPLRRLLNQVHKSFKWYGNMGVLVCLARYNDGGGDNIIFPLFLLSFRKYSGMVCTACLFPKILFNSKNAALPGLSSLRSPEGHITAGNECTHSTKESCILSASSSFPLLRSPKVCKSSQQVKFLTGSGQLSPNSLLSLIFQCLTYSWCNRCSIFLKHTHFSQYISCRKEAVKIGAFLQVQNFLNSFSPAPLFS